MKSDILKEGGLVERIISDLSVYCDIPNDGFLAGGAVANLLMRYCWEGESYPINDIDIFIEHNGDVFDSFGSSTPLRTNQLVIEGDGYMVTKLSYDHGSNYRIINVNRDGMLNHIIITSVNDRNNRNDYSYILNGFDFNCCQVGIDLRNNKLFYTDGFVEFLNYKQLEVTAIYTPSHTAIRLFKKIEELKCYCNIEESMELLSQPLVMENVIQLQRSHFGIYFSTKYKEMYMKYRSQIKEYFTMIRFFDHQKNIWNVRHSLENTIPDNHALSWLDPKKSIPKDLLDKWAKHNDIMWTLTPTKYNKPNEKITEILVGLNYNPLTFMNAYKIISGKMSNKLKSKAEKVVLDKYWLCKMVALVDKNFYDCDFDTIHLDYIENFLDKERWVLKHMLFEKMNIQESYVFIKDIKKIYNKEGEWISELLVRYLDNKNRMFKPTYENMVEGITKEKQKYAEDIIKPIDISSFILPKGVKIKEITSELDLKWAGRKLNNCMNNPSQNYAGKIKSGNTKLFVIITEKNMSGLELHLIEGTVYKVHQFLSYCNKITSEYHNILCNIFVNYLNMSHLKEIYDTKMNSYISIDLLNRGLLINVKDEKTDDNRVANDFPVIRMDHQNRIRVVDELLNEMNVGPMDFGLEEGIIYEDDFDVEPYIDDYPDEEPFPDRA